ncbi:MAG: hypothetical protein ACTS2F_04850 [Thainema sp.]
MAPLLERLNNRPNTCHMQSGLRSGFGIVRSLFKVYSTITLSLFPG